MNINAVEKSLCDIYIKSYENQKIDIDYVNHRQTFSQRIRNLDRQWPYDMRAMCQKHGLL